MINPNSDKAAINGYQNKTPQEQVHDFPLFFSKIVFDHFRHIRNLEVSFNSPITVLSGSNKSGKTSILLSIACSHYNFLKRNPNTGQFERTRWGDVMKFTNHDIQTEDWTYHVTYRNGQKSDRKRGQRKMATKKWNGVAKKESQIGTPKGGNNNGRKVYLIDMDRIMPARNSSQAIYKKAKKHAINPLSTTLREYLSYILEVNYNVGEIYAEANNKVFGYNTSHRYSSYNSASGEDALTRVLDDIIAAENKSLILIEEIEIGLHPKIQRRLMDIIYHEAKRNQKQFIITSHAPTILSSVNPESRVFIESNNNVFRAIQGISINAALTKMDADSYPLLYIYVEDEISQQLTRKVIEEINRTHNGFSRLVKVVIIGSAAQTYQYYKQCELLFSEEIINAGYACILDGDMRDKRKNDNSLSYPPEELLFFHYSSNAPEKMLLNEYLAAYPNETLQYHVNNSDPHCLLSKMVEEGVCGSKENAFEMCFNALKGTVHGQQYLNEMQQFIIGCCKKFSPDL